MEAEMRRARDRAQELAQVKGNILSLMKHEVRTPLNSIIGFSDIIRQQIEGPIAVKSYVQYAEYINESALRLNDALTDMIQYAALIAGDAKLTDDEYHVDKIVDWAAADVLPRAAQAEIAVEIRKPPCDLDILCDREQLVRSLRHLLDNAVVHGGKGPIEFVVERSAGGDLVFSISDRGPGIPPAQLAASTEPLGEVADGRLHPTPGLGLRLARRVSELHDGALDIRTGDNAGTIARIVLPARRVIDRHPRSSPSIDTVEGAAQELRLASATP
jgi:signal transduction histidine kinase